MNAQQLYDMMKKVQEPKGYCFNTDSGRVFELLDALILNKQRYGYMGCPCRLLAGDRDKVVALIAKIDITLHQPQPLLLRPRHIAFARPVRPGGDGQIGHVDRHGAG